MDFGDPAQRAIFFELHSGLPREGPGDRATVVRALALMSALPAAPVLLDIACGPGGQTLDLAELLPGAQITAVDLHAPFIREVERRAQARGVDHRVTAKRADMAALPFPPQSFDVLWCEGAAYIVGVDRALTDWKPLLRPGGYLALSEPVWLTRERPPAAETLWAAYPATGDAQALRKLAQDHGYEVIGDFVLPPEAWWTDYYGPLDARRIELEAKYVTDATAMGVLADARREIDAYRRHADAYG